MMHNRYREMKIRHQQEFSSWTEGRCFFAFSRKQFDEGMHRLGLDPEKDADKIFTMSGGGFYLKSEKGSLHELIDRQDRELKAALDADQTGDGFIYEAFLAELNDHEYSYTGDPEDALKALRLDAETIENSPALSRGLIKAAKELLDNEGE